MPATLSRPAWLTSGPIATSGCASGSPYSVPAMRAAILLVNSSATLRCTYTRSAQLHTCPVLITRES